MPDPTTPAQPSAPSVVAVSTLKTPSNLVPILLTVVLTLNAVFLFDHFFRKPTPAPTPDTPVVVVDPHFLAIGKSIEPQVAPTYARAWLAFKQALDAGQPFSAAQKALEDSWTKGRQTVAAPLLAELAKIVPPGTADAAVTPAQRAALSSAAAGIAQGLNKGKGFHLIPLSLPSPTVQDERPVIAATPKDGPFPDRAKLISQSITLPESKATEASSPMAAEGATLPGPSPSEPNWEWRTFILYPNLEAWGREIDGVFYYTETRHRAATFGPACYAANGRMVCGQ